MNYSLARMQFCSLKSTGPFVSQHEPRIPERHLSRAPSNLFPLPFRCAGTFPLFLPPFAPLARLLPRVASTRGIYIVCADVSVGYERQKAGFSFSVTRYTRQQIVHVVYLSKADIACIHVYWNSFSSLSCKIEQRYHICCVRFFYSGIPYLI